jgi:hypothetical protein
MHFLEWMKILKIVRVGGWVHLSMTDFFQAAIKGDDAKVKKIVELYKFIVHEVDAVSLLDNLFRWVDFSSHRMDALLCYTLSSRTTQDAWKY